MFNQKPVGFRASGYTPRLSLIALLMAIFSVLLTIFLANANKVHETYTARSYRVENGTVYETEYKKEVIRAPKEDEFNVTAGVTLEIQRALDEALVEQEEEITLEIASAEAEPVEAVVKEVTIVKHFPESTYIKGAIMLHGEAGGIKSLTEQSGPLWVACNRVDSSDPFFPDNLEAVIEQAWQFDGYTPGGEYTEAEYELAIDVFERWYREKNGEVNVGRTLPIEYIYFTGDGKHNYFRKTQTGSIYVWGSQLVSPYET